jgi:hypothetical protein
MRIERTLPPALAFCRGHRSRMSRAILVLFLSVIATVCGAQPKVLMLIHKQSGETAWTIKNEVNVMIDLLSQAGYQTAVATVDGKDVVDNGVTLHANLQISAANLDDYAAVLVPNMNAGDYPATKDIVTLLVQAGAKGMVVAAQGAYEVLLPSNIWKGHKISTLPGVVADGNLITSYNSPYIARTNNYPCDTDGLIAALVKAMAAKS